MHRIKKNIERQFAFNQGKNIFQDHLEMFQFSQETVKVISNIGNLNAQNKQFIIDYSTSKAIEGFYRVNQYYSFDLKAKNDLKQIYADLLETIQTKKDPIEIISKNHFDNLKRWIKLNNPFAEELYRNNNGKSNPVVCAEYSPELQIKIMQLDLKNIMPPVLDIGCGSHGHLVNYIKSQGIEVYGIDRSEFLTTGLITADWLDYDYTDKKWGTITSNLGFSNHFQHHNIRKDGNYIEYGKKYMEILKSLKIGGRFHYAPDLPFFEIYLDDKQYQTDKYEIEKFVYKTTVITRLKS